VTQKHKLTLPLSVACPTTRRIYFEQTKYSRRSDDQQRPQNSIQLTNFSQLVLPSPLEREDAEGRWVRTHAATEGPSGSVATESCIPTTPIY
jgi:hypothetical protein